MPAETSLRDGNPDEALAQLQDQVRKDPSNAKHRIFLFQLLAVTGEWNRALTQLNVAGDLDDGTLAMVQTYREALRCEVLRSKIFAGELSPMVFGEPEPWIALVIEALQHSAAGRHAQAAELRGSAFENAPATSGKIDDKPFEWIADADSRLGPVLEAVVNGRYYWVPFHRLHEIHLEQPEDLRDFVWTPAQFVFENGGNAVGLIPTRYTGSESSDDGAIRLARKTEWLQQHEDAYAGLGQRMLATDTGEYPLMDIRDILLETSELAGDDDRQSG